jgi:ABC-type transport system involved in multi-copper enzyme maturation permease subunit
MTGDLQIRRASYEPVPTWRRWMPLARSEFTSLFRTRWGVGLYFVCRFPGIGRLVMLMIIFGVVNFGPPELRGRLRAPPGLAYLDPNRVEFYVHPFLDVMPGMVFTLIVTSLVVARSIARDRTTNALELYWTRGISPRAYLLAKWWGCACLVGTLTVAVPFSLWATAVLLADDWSLLTSTALPMMQALLGMAAATAVWTALGILVSALCRSPNKAVVLWITMIVGTSAIGFVVAKAFGDWSLRSSLSVWHAGGVVARAVGGLWQPGDSIGGACLVLGSLLVVVAALAWRRLRLVEAVG